MKIIAIVSQKGGSGKTPTHGHFPAPGIEGRGTQETVGGQCGEREIMARDRSKIGLDSSLGWVGAWIVAAGEALL